MFEQHKHSGTQFALELIFFTPSIGKISNFVICLFFLKPHNSEFLKDLQNWGYACLSNTHIHSGTQFAFEPIFFTPPIGKRSNFDIGHFFWNLIIVNFWKIYKTEVMHVWATHTHSGTQFAFEPIFFTPPIGMRSNFYIRHAILLCIEGVFLTVQLALLYYN